MTYSKKILGICVSNRKNGNSSIILNELLRPAKEAGHEIEILDLRQVGMPKLFIRCVSALS